MTDHLSVILEKMKAVGCATSDPIILDNNAHRFAPNDSRKKDGAYQFDQDERGVWGWCIDYHEGVYHPISSFIKGARLTAEQLEAQRLKQEAHRAERARKAAAVAVAAQKIWEDSQEGNHPYLQRKRCKSNGSRVWRGGIIDGVYYKPSLVIPCIKDDQIISLQQIFDDGSKYFLKDGIISGGCAFIHGDPDQFVLCEGFSTGNSIWQATGLSVAVAFSATNLLPVATMLKDKVKIVAADDDKWKNNNVGLFRAKEAAMAVGARVVMPQFKNEDTKPTDFNDLHCLEDIDAVEAQIYPTPEIVQDWRVELIPKGDSFDKNSLNNLMIHMMYADQFRGMYRFDEFNRRVIVIADDAQVLDDDCVTNARLLVEKTGMKASKSDVADMIVNVAKKNKFNPAREYFNELKWDGIPRLDNWLIRYMGCVKEPEEYLTFVGKKWLMAAVKRVYEPGAKFDQMIVIEGAQGAGKSSALRVLATFGTEERSYFTDALKIDDMSRKDSMLITNGKIIVELAELVGLSKRDDDEMKHWLAVQVDEARMPYARHPDKAPRQFIVAGTTNKRQYLKDDTGNRRYWPFECGEIDLEGLERNREQLWAEAVWCYKQGHSITLTKEEIMLAKEQQARRMTTDPWIDVVAEAIVGLDHIYGFKATQVMAKLSMKLHDMDLRAEKRICSILANLGYKEVEKHDTITNQTQRMWVADYAQ